jgi:hypothetical protein
VSVRQPLFAHHLPKVRSRTRPCPSRGRAGKNQPRPVPWWGCRNFHVAYSYPPQPV